jgi:uncharacterized membrane protein YeaQ/YmgE (transglycosylase-associated protein family)
MGILAWVIAGPIAGFVAGRLVGHRSQSVAVDALVGMIGAFAGGLLYELVRGHRVTAFDVWGLAFAVAGALTTLLVWNVAAGLRQRRRWSPAR